MMDCGDIRKLEEQFPLHRIAFRGSVPDFLCYMRVCNAATFHAELNKKDFHGNTPLHIATMMGHRELIKHFLHAGATVRMKNNDGWNCLSEALSFGDRQIVVMLLRKLHSQARKNVEMRRPDLVQALCRMPDFYLQIKWDFQSWVPLVSRILPSDVCRIHKKGAKLRMDSTLEDFKDMHWARGDMTHLFNGHVAPKNSLLLLDNRLQEYKRLQLQETDKEVEDEADILMSSDILVAQLNTSKVTFERAKSGWLWKGDRQERIGPYNATFYNVGNLFLESRKRREHLTDDDLKKNKEILETFTKGAVQEIDFEHRESVLPPPSCQLEWEDYLATKGQTTIPSLRRKIKMKENNKHFKATVAMSEEFPIEVSELLDILEVIAPFKHFTRLREFLEHRLPPGFPVRIEMPVFPTVTAKVTFQEFQYRNDLSDDLFRLPSEYKRSRKNYNL